MEWNGMECHYMSLFGLFKIGHSIQFHPIPLFFFPQSGKYGMEWGKAIYCLLISLLFHTLPK